MMNFKENEEIQEVEEEFDYLNEEPLEEDDSNDFYEYDEGRNERECE